MLSSTCQHVARLQFDNCAEKNSLFGTVMMAWIWHVDQCHGVGSHGTSSSQGWRQRIVIKSKVSICLQSKFDRWVYILVFVEGPEVIVAGLPRKAFPRKYEKVDTGRQCFSVVAQAMQDSPKASPRKNFIEQLKLLLKWMLIERWRAQHAEFNVPTCGKIAVWQLCREKQPFWNSHDGLNLTCLDQCHGVGSHGTSSSQGWRKRIVIKSTV